MILRRISRNRRQNQGEDLFVLFSVFTLNFTQNFFSYIRKVLENQDLGKRHKIWAKFHCLHKIFFG